MCVMGVSQMAWCQLFCAASMVFDHQVSLWYLTVLGVESAGEIATMALKQRIGSASIACQVRAKDLYQRNVSSCSLQGTGDLGDWMVQNGHAVAYR